MMRRGASLHRDNAWRLIRKQLHQLATGYRPVEDTDAIRPDATNLKTVLGEVDRKYPNSDMDASLILVPTKPLCHIRCRRVGASTASVQSA